MSEFLTDIETLRRAREHMDQRPITEARTADRERVISVRNEVLATELVCLSRCKRHFYAASGINSRAVAAEFAPHANEEMGHADPAATPITQQQGEPDGNSKGVADCNQAGYVEGTRLIAMIKKDRAPSGWRSRPTGRPCAGWRSKPHRPHDDHRGHGRTTRRRPAAHSEEARFLTTRRSR